MNTQLFARIKKRSKYYGQGTKGELFEVSVRSDPLGYVFEGGPGGCYCAKDIALFAKVGHSEFVLLNPPPERKQ